MQNEHFKLGRHPRRAGVKRLQYAAFCAAAPVVLPPLPEKVYYERLIRNWMMFKNDVLSNCTAAAVAHSRMNAVAHGSGNVLTCTPTQGQVDAFYSATTGWIPGKPETDQGGDEDVVLDYAVKNGFAGSQLIARVEIDPTNIDHIKQAIHIFGSVYTGIEL